MDGVNVQGVITEVGQDALAPMLVRVSLVLGPQILGKGRRRRTPALACVPAKFREHVRVFSWYPGLVREARRADPPEV